MITKGIRGAITVEQNTEEAIKTATLELLNEMITQNSISKRSISHVFFTLTEDLNAAFPAKFAREELKWTDAAMICFHELNVPGSLQMCLRVLIVVNCIEGFVPKFVYMKGAKDLRN